MRFSFLQRPARPAVSERHWGNLFISAGAMKSGTTWLYDVLRLHPDLHFSMVKESHYLHQKFFGPSVLNDEHRLATVKKIIMPEIIGYTRDLPTLRRQIAWVDRYIRDPLDDDWYADILRTDRPVRYSCDFSNLYALLPPMAWQAVERNSTELRVIYTMRDPLHRLWSNLKFDLRFNGHAEGPERWSAARIEAYVRQPDFWSSCEYGHAIRNMTQGLSPGTVRFFFMPEHQTDPLSIIREIEDFLGIAAHAYPEEVLTNRVNASEVRAMPDFLPELFAADFARIKTEMRAADVEPPTWWT